MIGLIKGLPRKVNMAGSPQPIVTFTSNVKGLDIPEILAYITATQAGSGDPSPSNPRPISGVSSVDTTRTGKNLLSTNETLGTVSGVTATLNADGSITLNGTSTGSGTIRLNRMVSLPYATYTFTAESRTGVAISVQTSGGNKSASSTGITFTASVSGLFWIYFNSSGIVFDNYTIHPQLELGSTATSYEPYTGTTATTNLGGTYYGGTLNVGTGLLTVTHGYEKLDPQETWVYSSSWSKTNTNVFYMLNVNQNIHYSSYDDEAVKLCNLMPTGSRNQIYNADDNIVGVSGAVGTPQITVRILKSLCADTSAFLNFITNNDVYICYELATPQTYQLTPAQIEQLLGQNNVFASTGDVEVTQIWARRDRSIISRG